MTETGPDGGARRPRCPSCGTTNGSTANFCRDCGQALGAQPSPVGAPPVAPGPSPVSAPPAAAPDAPPGAPAWSFEPSTPDGAPAPGTAARHASPGAWPPALAGVRSSVMALPPVGKIVLAAGVALALVLGLRACGEASHTIEGSLTLQGDDNIDRGGLGCQGDGGFSDLSSGADVRVTDGSGDVIAVGEMGIGRYSSVLEECTFEFTIEDVPEVKIYEVAAGGGRRGGPNFTLDEMKDNDWSVSLTIGD